MITCVIVGAGGRGKDAYAPYIKSTGIMKIVGVAEPDERKRELFKKAYNIPDENCFENYADLFSKGKINGSRIFISSRLSIQTPQKLYYINVN